MTTVIKGGVYDPLRNTTSVSEIEETRWKVLKAMLNDFPLLKQRTERYLQANDK